MVSSYSVSAARVSLSDPPVSLTESRVEEENKRSSRFVGGWQGWTPGEYSISNYAAHRKADEGATGKQPHQLGVPEFASGRQHQVCMRTKVLFSCFYTFASIMVVEAQKLLFFSVEKRSPGHNPIENGKRGDFFVCLFFTCTFLPVLVWG